MIHGIRTAEDIMPHPPAVDQRLTGRTARRARLQASHATSPGQSDSRSARIAFFLTDFSRRSR